jgi:tRNA A-37 threonylcarbamoyl transferase component Bud32
MNGDLICHNCGALLRAEAMEGVCPACGLKFGCDDLRNTPILDTPADSPPSQLPNPLSTVLPDPDAGPEPDPGEPFGKYKLLELIAKGGMGKVYKARRDGHDGICALKLIKPSLLESQEARERFLREAKAAANLNHQGIVRIDDVGEHEGQHYYVMEFLEGKNLAHRVIGGPLPQHEAAELVREVAEAVHFAHQRGVIHRDLKPHNIMLGGQGQPKVIDFGLAKRLPASVPGVTNSDQILGTPPYMPPEQARGEAKNVDCRADVYALGATLYHLLAGRPPFQAAGVVETLRQVIEEDPVAVQRLNPGISRDLDTIVMTCLEKAPKHRYQTAADLSADLHRLKNKESIKARRLGPVRRLWHRAVRRQPVATALAILAIGLSIVTLTTAGLVSRSYEAMRVGDVGRRNLQDAKDVASTVQLDLERLSLPVANLADEPQLRKLLEQDDRGGLQAYIEQTLRDHANPAYESWYVLDAAGKLLAVWPENGTIISRNYSGRDYFRIAMRLARESGKTLVHISRVFRAENDGLYKFAISAPVRSGPGPDSAVLGVIAATITTRSTLGRHRLDDKRRQVVLVSRSDPNPPRSGGVRAPGLYEYLILFHPVYDRGNVPIGVPDPWFRAVHQPHPGDEFELPPDRGTDPVQAINDNYQDPLGMTYPDYRGRWLAGFAPVGNTELGVIIQQRYDEAIGPDPTLALVYFLKSIAALCLGVVLLVIVGAGLRWPPKNRSSAAADRRIIVR